MNPYFDPRGLPQNPPWPFNQQHQPQQTYQNAGYSSHYMQAIMQSQAGYYQQPQAAYGGFHQNPSMSGPSNQPSSRSRPPPTGSWYQPGNKRCTYKNCTFSGSHSALETHMMDRHLIYPPGWDKRKKKSDWDADPSLKGKPVPIQGTNISLDDPEQLAKWIEERKKRFPTKDKVEDKKRKMEEAISRGQLTAEDMGMRPDKRRRTNDSEGAGRGRGNNRPGGRGRGGPRGGRGGGDRDRGRGGAMSGPSAAPQPEPLPIKGDPAALPPKPAVTTLEHDLPDADSSASDSDEAPDVVSSKKGVAPLVPEIVEAVPTGVPASEETTSTPRPADRKRPPPQPKQPPRNPFANRTSLLRNLILPEIRVTVSNLSQAIRFLVDNDFLQGVELKPGEASDTPIQVLNTVQHHPEP